MEENNAQIKKYEVPSIEQLYEERQLKERESQLNALLNNPPKDSWIQNHPTAKKEVRDANNRKIKVPVEHLPIARIEWLLTWIFKRFRWEIQREQLIANSVVVTVRLWFMNPIVGEWDFHDGIGAVPLQTEKDAGAIEWNKLNAMAVHKGAGAAESFARKNAAKKLGKLFGRDLNREEDLNYEIFAKRFDQREEIQQLQNDLSLIIGSVEDEQKAQEFRDRVTAAEVEKRNPPKFYEVLIQEIQTYLNQNESDENK